MRFVCKVGVVILIASFFLMSHNAGAIDATFNLNDYEQLNFDVTQNYYDYKIYNANGTLNHQCLATFNCTVGNNQQIRVAATHDSFPLKAGDIIFYNLALYSPVRLHHIDNLQFRSLAPGYGVSTLYFHEVSDFSAIGGFTESFPTGSGNGYIQTDGYFVSNLYEIALIANIDGNRQLGSFNQNTVDIAVNMGNTSTSDVLVVAVTGFTVYRYKGSAVNKEQAQATQDAADDSETQAEGNSSSTQTTNLIGAFQSFVTALTSLNATNCNVTLAWPSSLGGNMQVNICQNKDYAGNIISVFGSLTLIVFYIPFSLKILSMIYNEIRSFTNG